MDRLGYASLGLCAALAMPGSGMASQGQQSADARADLKDMACPFEPSPALAGRIRCGQLLVPENRGVEIGRAHV